LSVLPHMALHHFSACFGVQSIPVSLYLIFHPLSGIEGNRGSDKIIHKVNPMCTKVILFLWKKMLSFWVIWKGFLALMICGRINYHFILISLLSHVTYKSLCRLFDHFGSLQIGFVLIVIVSESQWLWPTKIRPFSFRKSRT